MTDISHEQLLESLFDGVYYVDSERKIVFWNRAAERITGYKKSEVIGSCCSENILRHIDDDGRELCIGGCPLAATIQDGRTREARVYLHHKQGHRVPVSVRISPVRDAEGKIIGGVEVFEDNSNLLLILKELEQAKHEAYVDGLTSVGNRRYCEMTLQTKLFEMKSFETPFGVVFLDIDNFKRFNDSHGHAAGDAVLAMLGKTVTNALRRLDTIARWGGEEFVAILPNVNADVLGEVAERIRVFVERSFIMEGEEKLSVSMSLGATLARPDDTPESVIRRADSLMYRSKAAGRNRVTIG